MDVENLRHRRDRLANELGKLDALLASIDAYVAEFQMEDAHANPTRIGRTLKQVHSVNGAEPTLTDLTADAAEAAIIKANEPLSLARLEDVVRAAGVSLPEGKKARNILGARLYNSGRFIADRGTGYSVKDRPRPGELDIASNDADENGAPDGDAEGTPETGEAVTSPVDNRPGLRLIG